MILFIHIFFFNDTATTEIYTLSLHDALPICLFSSSLLEIRTATRLRRFSPLHLRWIYCLPDQFAKSFSDRSLASLAAPLGREATQVFRSVQLRSLRLRSCDSISCRISRNLRHEHDPVPHQ